MFSYAFSTVSTYFYLPFDEEEDRDIESYQQKYLTWTADDIMSKGRSSEPHPDSARNEALDLVLTQDDLYQVLGLAKSATIDKTTLRRAYLSRSRACHPDKFTADKQKATLAFQKVAIAYDVLSKPSSRRLYDNRSSSSTWDVFANNRPSTHAEETFTAVVIGVINDFLDGDLEVIRTFLKAINDMNPSLSLGDEGINSLLITLQAVRERALTCRACIHALHAEVCRLLEVQYAMRQLSYFDLFGRSRLTIQLTRIAIGLPIAMERAVASNQASLYPSTPSSESTLLPRHLMLLIRGVDGALGRMEGVLKPS